MSIYDYSFERLTGEEKESLAKYKNQVLLIVNTASKCGFTPQYEGLEHLYEKYKDKGFAVLGFPSDSFMKQEFDESEKIAAFCQANYGVTFPLFKKSKMKGKEMNPLFAELLEQAGEKKITWNFNKFLVDRHGHVIGYYGSRTKPEELEAKIEELLQA
ncbi:MULTISPECIES: glutathione peroxidase [Heyndrickxia]|uniref:Glutathione peroxidase n=1 Tax=Heyndrickxia coagulans DSM 1 = ATCC 7050 TaxID=1121088 RepID=A0A8B4BW99_HEYCO|nr:glutathione peroxidase [Heyndrickxia coagulans]AJH78052.1 glutathione peroxidase family protein [Heyndrickxia coagulans DSM 1 = ATCC 7050]MCR2847304.1 glutathione peroxidase [Heyndrickxia coagulans]MDR4225317.1 glutathione peroxidase [Heyndrickxia coagulans DSM 1 = ATCC 7050]MEC5270241.1 glutathione peroxidase [Heyndrickxia coagulans]MED4313304.1 glutathione peroxidase [Heyndrickxia coagulans]